MKIYKTTSGIVFEHEGKYYSQFNEDWDTFVNDDNLYEKLLSLTQVLKPDSELEQHITSGLMPPIQSQEIWGSGVTYLRSKVGRQEESKDAGGGDFYERVYSADRPELFFKSTASRAVGSGDFVKIRKDSTWDVPEPELTLFATSNAKIVGYTIGNDMSSRSIEGVNPLYLPQAKTYDASAAIGPCIYVSEKPLSPQTVIVLEIFRRAEKVFEGEVEFSQMIRKPEDLIEYLHRECSFPHGSFLMTGTGIVPGSDFTLKSGDEIRITIEPIGTLINTVE